MKLVLDFTDYFYKQLEEDVKDFNLTAYDMNIEPVSVSQYVVYLISKDIDEHKKKRCESEKKRTQKN